MRRDHRHVIVLAGGSGTRLSALTSTADGIVVPKQYCSLRGDRSLLADTIARAERIVPRDHVTVVVAAEHERFWRREFERDRDIHVVVQPENRGTAAGILLPLLAVLHRDPDAQVTLLPSDHFVADEEGLAAALSATQDVAASHPERVLLLGIEPDAPEGDYGWITPGPALRGARGAGRQGALGGTREVAAFVEKPGREEAARLMARGSVWNAFLVAASGTKLLDLYGRRLRDLLQAFVAVEPHLSPTEAKRLYRDLDSADFSRDLMQEAPDELALRVAPACGWTDLGTPDRLRQFAATHGRQATGAGPEVPQLLLTRRVAHDGSGAVHAG